MLRRSADLSVDIAVHPADILLQNNDLRQYMRNTPEKAAVYKNCLFFAAYES